MSSELDNVNTAIQETLHAASITTDENVIPVGKKQRAAKKY